MEDEVTYGVFWVSKDANRWALFAGWSNEKDAMAIYKDLVNNPMCKRRRIVERVEAFEVLCEE